MTDTQESSFRDQATSDHRFGFLRKYATSEWLLLLSVMIIAVAVVVYHSNVTYVIVQDVQDLREDVKALKRTVEEKCGEGEQKRERNIDRLTGTTFDSCKEIFDSQRSYRDKAYPLHVGGRQISIYCHMTPLEGCGGGGWTMVMKIDGTKENFNYDSALWTDRKPFNTQGGETGFDTRETKLPTYWKTPFSKICVGMKVGNDQINFQVIDQLATSLHSLIADGQYRATSLGRDNWKNLIGPEASLQDNCNKEGFNAKPDHINADQSDASKARIGIVSNNEKDCHSPDSRIGFGTAGYVDKNQSCGNVGRNGADNGDKNIPVMGYILVQ